MQGGFGGGGGGGYSVVYTPFGPQVMFTGEGGPSGFGGGGRRQKKGRGGRRGECLLYYGQTMAVLYGVGGAVSAGRVESPHQLVLLVVLSATLTQTERV